MATAWYLRVETIVSFCVALLVLTCCTILVAVRCICARRRRVYQYGFVETTLEERQKLRNEKKNLISGNYGLTNNQNGSFIRVRNVSELNDYSTVSLSHDEEAHMTSLLNSLNESLRGTDLTVDRALSYHELSLFANSSSVYAQSRYFVARNSQQNKFLIRVLFSQKNYIENENEKLAFLAIVRHLTQQNNSPYEYIYPLSSIEYSVNLKKCTIVKPVSSLGNVSQFLKNNGPLSNFQISLFGRQVLLGIQHLERLSFPVEKYVCKLDCIHVTMNDRVKDKEARYVCALSNFENVFLLSAPNMKLQDAPQSSMQNNYILSFGHFLFEIATGNNASLHELSQLESLRAVPQLFDVLNEIFMNPANQKISTNTLLMHPFFNTEQVKRYDASLPSTNIRTLDKLNKRVEGLLSKMQDSKKYKQMQRQSLASSYKNSSIQPITSSSVSASTPASTSSAVAPATPATTAPPPPPPMASSAPPPPPSSGLLSNQTAAALPPPQPARSSLLDEIRMGTKLTLRN